MKSPLAITEVRFFEASAEDVATGLLGWVDCVLNGAVRLSGITLRRTREGRLTLSYPLRPDRLGREHFAFRPITDQSRIDLERQVIGALGHVVETP